MNCRHCGADTTNGLALCELCQRKGDIDLDFLPIYFRNLARWRPGRAGSRPVPGSRVLYDGDKRVNDTGDRISDRLDEAYTALTTWARALVDDRPECIRPLTLTDAALMGEVEDRSLTVTLLCSALQERLTSIATLDWCGEFVRDLGHHEAVLRGLTEVAVPGWYAGACSRQISMDARCGAPTYVVPGLTWVICSRCGTTTYARDHLETILTEARDWVARPMRLAEATVALVDTELSVQRLYERIKKWEQREKIDAHRKLDADGDPVGAKRYRMGDVLDLIFGEGATRLDAEKARAS